MADLGEGSIHRGVEQTWARWSRKLQGIQSPVARYSLSVLWVAIACGIGLVFQHYGFRSGQWGVFGAALALATWYGGLGPSVVAAVLAVAAFDYFFTEPEYSFAIVRGDLAYFLSFAAFALAITWFSLAHRRSEERLHQAYEELAKRAADLEASNKELESFAYTISHDIRAPLRHVVGYSELLQKHASTSLDDKSQRYIRTILEAARRMGYLVDDLLAFSRIGRAQTKMTAVDLDQLVKDVVSEIAQDAKGPEITWKIGPLPTCYGDRSMLRLVVSNLVSNAVKFTRTRTPAEIEIGCVSGKNEVFVRDNGVGFDMRYVDKLFGVFQRLHLPEHFEGTGIGLATVQRIVHRHGGNVRAEGAVDRGATFSFSLPKIDTAPERTAYSR
jgi:signal transduction histidine kinase